MESELRAEASHLHQQRMRTKVDTSYETASVLVEIVSAMTANDREWLQSRLEKEKALALKAIDLPPPPERPTDGRRCSCNCPSLE